MTSIQLGPHKITGQWIRVDNVANCNCVAVVVAMAVELNNGEWPGLKGV